METPKNSAFIDEPCELRYILEIVNRVLSKPQELSSIEDFQAAIKKLSSKKGREIQTHLIADPLQKGAIGVNFSFADNPAKVTPTLSLLAPHEIEVVESPLHLVKYSSGGAIVPQVDPSQTGLPVEETTPTSSESQRLLKSPASEQKISGLANIAEQLASRNQLDGLWLTGLSLKAAANLVQPGSKPIDKQAAGEAIIKRFEHLLPDRFDDLHKGQIPKPFTWKDPASRKKYRFEFEKRGDGKESTIHLLGFELSEDSRKNPVFSASSLDSRRWAIARNDFTANQLHSLSLAENPNRQYRGESVKSQKLSASNLHPSKDLPDRTRGLQH